MVNLLTIHDDLLFNAQLNTGFTGLLHLGEMTWPNRVTLRDYKKVTMRFSMEWTADSYSFWLPTHKTDTTFEGNWIVVKKITGAPDPHPIIENYTKSCNTIFPFHPQLWLRSNGSIPLRSWIIKCLWHYFSAHIARQSLWAGGTTAMAEAGPEPQLIKGARRGTSNAFERSIRKNPVVLHTLILTHSLHYNTWPEQTFSPQYFWNFLSYWFPLSYSCIRTGLLPYYSSPTCFHLTCSSHRLRSTYKPTKHKTNFYIWFCHFSRSVQIFLGLPGLPSREAAFHPTLRSLPWANAKWELAFKTT